MDARDDGIQWDHVGRWTFEQYQVHGILGGGLPGDGERLADRDYFAKAGREDWVARGSGNLPNTLVS